MMLAELHAWATEQRDAPDTRLRRVAAGVQWLLRERADLITTEYMTLREDLRRAQGDVANLQRELARLRALLNAQKPAPWEQVNRPVQDAG